MSSGTWDQGPEKELRKEAAETGAVIGHLARLFTEWAGHSLGTSQALGWEAEAGVGFSLARGLGSKTVCGPSWRVGGGISSCIYPAPCPHQSKPHINTARRLLDGVVHVGDRFHIHELEGKPAFHVITLAHLRGRGGFVIIPNLEMKTVRLREPVGLTLRLGAGVLKAAGAFHTPRLGADHSVLRLVPLISSPASIQTALCFLKYFQVLFSLTSIVPA